MNGKNLSDDNLIELKTQAHFRRGPDAGTPSSDLDAPTPMVVDVEEIDFYDRNPRRAENPEFQNIKGAIRASKGLSWVLNITRRPGSEHYMLSAGGNTTLRAVKELLEETGEPCFRQIHCLHTPWTGDDDVLLAHLKENDQRSDLVFIDRARAVRELRKLIETEAGKPLSQRGFVEQLKARGYNISRTMLGWLDYAVDVLLPAIPDALGAGMGKSQVEQLHKLEQAFNTTWAAFDLEASEIEGLFTGVLKRHDWECVDPDLVREDLQAELSVSADCEYEHARYLLGLAHDKGLSADEIRAKLAKLLEADKFIDDESLQFGGTRGPATVGGMADAVESSRISQQTHEPASPPPDSLEKDTDANTPEPVAPKPLSCSSDTNSLKDPPASEFPDEETSPASPAVVDIELPEDLKSLRDQAFRLACDIAAEMGAEEIIVPIDAGYGFLVGPLPNGGHGLTNAYSRAATSESDTILTTSCLWWMLATVSEQFSLLGSAIPHIPPEWSDRHIGEAMRQAKHFTNWQFENFNKEAVRDVPFVPLPLLGVLALNVVEDHLWDTWVELVNATRRIFRLTQAEPWN